MHTYRHIVAIICLYLCAAGVQHVGAVQEVLVLSPGHHWLRQLPQIQLEERCHRVDICVTAGAKNQSLKHINSFVHAMVVHPCMITTAVVPRRLA